MTKPIVFYDMRITLLILQYGVQNTESSVYTYLIKIGLVGISFSCCLVVNQISIMFVAVKSPF